MPEVEQTQLEIPAEMGVEDAADAMRKAGLFAEPGEHAEKPKRQTPAKDPATGKFIKAEQAETPEGEEPPPEETDADAKPDETEEAEETAEEQAEAIRKLKVKLDGMEQELPEEEVVKGYLRQADYTRKTQELAEQRKRFDAEEVAPLREEREYYRQRVAAIEEALEALAPSAEPDWEAEAQRLTPEEFGQRFTAWKKGQDQKAKVQAEHARVRALQEEQDARDRATRLRQEQEKLEAAIPDWKDPVKGKMLREDLTAFAKSVWQFTDDDLDGIEDHRALAILNESRLWRESQKRRPTVAAKVEKAIEVMKPSGSPTKPRPKEAAQANQRFLQTGSVEDAAAAMKAAKIFG